ncbi:hypothetical protein [Nocardioides ochotonae]|uniref:hypothetical protein n=1 Tax=Nocardioides ochotonae TaxID=2685869 RepID=UPI001408E8FC|nr:hypothetical protein [Nocardioides ochotonae]
MERDETLQRLRVGRAVLALAALGLVVVAFWLSVDNPTIGKTSRGAEYTCLAPWDTVLNRASNYPGGEPPRDGDQIASRCREAGEERFRTAVTFGAAAGAVALVASVVGLITYRRDRRLRPDRLSSDPRTSAV